MPVLHESFPVAAAAIRAGRHRACDFALEHGATERQAADVALAVSEALTNAVLHSGAPTPDGLELHLSCEDAELTIAVRDHGRGLRPRLGSPGAGLGLPIIARLARRLEITRPHDGGTEVRMVFALAG